MYIYTYGLYESYPRSNINKAIVGIISVELFHRSQYGIILSPQAIPGGQSFLAVSIASISCWGYHGVPNVEPSPNEKGTRELHR